MIISKTTLVKVNPANIKHLLNKSYSNLNIGDSIEVYIEDLTKGSHSIIECICHICENIYSLEYRNYLKRIEKCGYYTCKGKCSTIKIEEFNMNKYGTKSIFHVEYIKNNIKNTMLNKYGEDNASKIDIFKNKRQDTMNDRYGVNHYFIASDFKEKSEETCLKNYGVTHPLKVKDNVKNMLNKRGLDFETNEFKMYRREVDKLTRKNKKKLLEYWDGYDFYDNEYIKDNYELRYYCKDYPTIDHIKPLSICFKENLIPYEVAKIENLCITKRWINSKKYNKIDFIL